MSALRGRKTLSGFLKVINHISRGIDTSVSVWYTGRMYVEASTPVERKMVPAILEDQDVIDVVYPPCTKEEDDFALAVVEHGGNVRSAYQAAFGDQDPFPVSRGTQLIKRPQVALRIKELTDKIEESSLVSLTSHLMELADIRDLAKMSGQLKTALSAEVSRGTVVGLYKMSAAPPNPVAVQVNFVNRYDHSV